MFGLFKKKAVKVCTECNKIDENLRQAGTYKYTCQECINEWEAYTREQEKKERSVSYLMEHGESHFRSKRFEEQRKLESIREQSARTRR